jgi:glyoxylase I family protein
MQVSNHLTNLTGDLMKIEHLAMLVKDPLAVAKWYTDVIGLRVVRQGPGPNHMHFLADDGNHVMIEIYTNETVPVPDYWSMDPLVLHLALVCANMQADHAKLVAAGCTPVGDISTTAAGDKLAMLRDPWGFAIQLADRMQPMI